MVGPSGLADLSLWSGPQQVSFHHHHHHITPSLTEGEKVKRQANRQTLWPRALGLGLDCRVNPLTKRAVFNPGVLFSIVPFGSEIDGVQRVLQGNTFFVEEVNTCRTCAMPLSKAFLDPRGRSDE